MSDVVLTAALRSNLLSLQNTQNLIDQTQFRLATGREVNSALDNPQNFFASQALNNRASDLGRLLDGLGQNIQVIEAADNGISALTDLVQQADSVAQQARDTISAGSAEARLLGNRDLRGIDTLQDLSGINDGVGLSEIVVQVTDPSDGTLVDFDANNAGQDNAVVTIGATDSIEELITNLNDFQDSATGERVFEASLNESGFLQIRSLNGGDLSVEFTGDTDSVITRENTAANLAFANALGFGNTAARVEDGNLDGNGAQRFDVVATSVATSSLTSVSLFRDDGNGGFETARASDGLDALFADDTGTNALITGFDATSDDQLVVGVNNDTRITINLDDANDNPTTVQGLVDRINNDTNINGLIRADFNTETGQISLRAIDSSVETIEFGLSDDVDAGGTDITTRFGFGVNATQRAVAANGADALNVESIRLSAAAGQLAELESEFDNIRTQIDQLVQDTGYRGTNLLNGDNLTSFFNEDRTSSLITEGVVFNSAGLGLLAADFGRVETVDSTLTNVRSALESVRAFGTTLANDLAIIQTRQDFINETVNTLQEGSDRLTIADQNEEGARLLSLQTRQQLGVTSLSLASQSQQSVLRLF